VKMRSGLLIAALFAPSGLSSQAPILARCARLEPCEGLPAGMQVLRICREQNPAHPPWDSCRNKKAPMLVEALMLEYKWR
ncbi:hypothetical protein A9R01_12525, partial ['Osedax' symbiont bacterium Rs2_46_30_T18]